VKDFSHGSPGSVGQKPANHGYHTGDFVKTIDECVHSFSGEGVMVVVVENNYEHVHSFSRAEHR
jgi:hypothetical protein